MGYGHLASRPVTNRKGEYSGKGLCILYTHPHTVTLIFTRKVSSCSLLIVLNCVFIRIRERDRAGFPNNNAGFPKQERLPFSRGVQTAVHVVLVMWHTKNTCVADRAASNFVSPS
jgi:hypothetical protein